MGRSVGSHGSHGMVLGCGVGATGESGADRFKCSSAPGHQPEHTDSQAETGLVCQRYHTQSPGDGPPARILPNLPQSPGKAPGASRPRLEAGPTFVRAEGVLHVFGDQDVQQLLPAGCEAGMGVELGLQLRLWGGRWGGAGFPGGSLLLSQAEAIILEACKAPGGLSRLGLAVQLDDCCA